VTRGRRGGSEPRVGSVPADKRLEIRLTPDQLAEWTALAEEHGMASLAELVRTAVSAFARGKGSQRQVELADFGREVVASARKRFPKG